MQVGKGRTRDDVWLWVILAPACVFSLSLGPHGDEAALNLQIVLLGVAERKYCSWGTSVPGKSHFALILATLSGLSSLPQCLGKDS